MKKPEILAPAGDLEKLKTAFMYGADACYMGVKSMSMRVRENKAERDDIREALRLVRELNKKLYLTMNIHAHETRLSFLQKEIDHLKALHDEGLDPDAILVSDVGILTRLREECPWLQFHISTQANTLNSAGIEFWAKQKGVTRVVLGREVSLAEVKAIRKELKKKGIAIELEAFVHGAMCMAYSGRCLLSSFMANRDANEGMCAHSCRWSYKVHRGHESDSQFFLEEELRPGEHIPIEEDEFGTYVMSSKDMCMVQYLRDLVEAGVDSLKIEGRHKTIYYVALTSRAYREALDLAMEKKKPSDEIMELVESVNTRGYFTGFWYGRPGAEGQKYKDYAHYNEKYCFAGVVRQVKGKQVTLEVKNRLDQGDKLDIITPSQTIPMVLDNFRNAKTGEPVEAAHAGQGFLITFQAPQKLEAGYVVRKTK
ncbi:MAG: U32 family peptidase C-terminal domain-containing protein [Candidatus Peregrinibacteria bacterium]